MTTTQAESHGYTNIKFIDGKCYGIYRFIFTTGLVVGIDDTGYQYRFCYKQHIDAVKALEEWDGVEDPPGDWIKEKGLRGDRSNPKLKVEVIESPNYWENTGVHPVFEKYYKKKVIK